MAKTITIKRKRTSIGTTKRIPTLDSRDVRMQQLYCSDELEYAEDLVTVCARFGREIANDEAEDRRENVGIADVTNQEIRQHARHYTTLMLQAVLAERQRQATLLIASNQGAR